MVQTSHVDFEWPQSESAETTTWTFSLLTVLFHITMARCIDDVLPIVMYCLARFVGLQRVRDNQSSKINAPRIFCVKACAALTHSEKNAHLALHITYIHVGHYISRRAFTYHVEPLHIMYIHVDGVVHTKRSGSSLRSIRRSFLQAITALNISP